MFKLTIKTDNAAFADDPEAELARILADVAERVADGEMSGKLRDANGNTVGEYSTDLRSDEEA